MRRCSCEPLGGKNADVIVEALNRHRGFLRGELGRTIELKFTPELRFVEDTSFAEAQRIEQILHSEKVARDLKRPGRAGKGRRWAVGAASPFTAG